MSKTARKRRILLVEDEALIALNAKEELRALGYSVEIANSGDKAIDRALAPPQVDLILMDIDLGSGIDGTETASAILEQQDLPILFVSSHSEPEIVARTEEITSYGYVLKTGGPAVLDAAIKMAFRLYDARREQEHLRETAEQYLGLAAEIVLGLDTDGTITLLNDSGHRLLGYPRGSLIGENWFDRCLPSRVRRHVRDALEVGITAPNDGVTHYENEIITRDGETRKILWHNTILTDREGRATGILSSGEDITERDLLEKQLMEERRVLRRQSELQELLIDLSSTYLAHSDDHPDRIAETIQGSLAALGEKLRADRAYVFDYRFEQKVAVNTFEWTAPGVDPQIAELQAVPLEAIAEAIKLHKQGEPHFVQDVGTLRAGGMRQTLEPQGIRTLLTVPILRGQDCLGCVGFDYVREHHQFSKEEQDILTVFARGIAAIGYRNADAPFPVPRASSHT